MNHGVDSTKLLPFYRLFFEYSDLTAKNEFLMFAEITFDEWATFGKN